MNLISLIAGVVALAISIMLILAILRIFSIDATLKKILKKLDAMDKNRRDEFNALAES